MKSFATSRLIASAALVVGAALVVSFMQSAGNRALAQQAGQPSATAKSEAKNLLDPKDAVILLLDHQTGLFQTVKDVGIAELRSNATTLAKLAKLAKVPLIITASEPNGPNGPIMPEIQQSNSDAIYVPRKGEISAWDNELFQSTVRKTGKKTLIIAGVWTSVCVAFPAIQAKAEGFDVYFVTDASGDPSVMASQTTIARMAQAGITPTSTNAVVCEFQRTWNRPDAAEYGALYPIFNPNYGAVVESYKKAQEAATQPKK